MFLTFGEIMMRITRGDFNYAGEADIAGLMKGDASGRAAAPLRRMGRERTCR